MDTFETPTLKRRFICMIYESMLLFGVIFIAILIFSIVFRPAPDSPLQYALRAWLFLVLAAYFVWFWSNGRQTLAMKTWSIRMRTTQGELVPRKRALLRFLLAWLWIAPGVILDWVLGAKGWMLALYPALNILLWGLASRFDRERQFIHDRLAGTRLQQIPKPPRQATGAASSQPA